MSDEEKSPAARIEAVLSAIADAVREDPRVRMTEVARLGLPVVCVGAEAVPLVDLVLLARQGEEAFRSTLWAFKPADLKKIAKAHGLDSGIPNARGPMIDHLWDGAVEQSRNYKPTSKA